MFGIGRSANAVAKLRRVIGWPPYHELDIPMDAIEPIVRSTGAEPWFVWAIQNRRTRGESNSAMDWIVKHIPKDSLIFEVGCGCGANLIWLAEHGFHNLVGTDRSASAIAAAKQLANLAKQTISFDVANGFLPSEHLTGSAKINVLLAINCIYYAPIDMVEYLKGCRDQLTSDGAVIFDMVDRSYDYMPNNQYLEDDWRLPEAKRRPTQYVVRMSPDEMRDKATMAGFVTLNQLPGTKLPPRYVTVLRLRASRSAPPLRLIS
jgi:SAM-dependent methyltransferase